MRRPAVLAAALGVLVALLPATGRAAAAPVRTSGYLTMADGVHLRYTVVRPARPGRYPTLFEYSGYDPGTNPDAAYVRQFVERDGGYAYIGVNVRGTGCSEGTFDFFQPAEARDGAAVVAWIRRQAWSDGTVGMIGKSYPGITQLFVAAQQPPGLAAIAPGHFFADAYRDVARPGGLANIGFSSLWSFIGRPSYEFQSSPAEVAAGDAGCVRGSVAELRDLPTNPFVQLVQHPDDDPLYAERSPVTYLDRIRVPMLATLAWQDEQLASRQTDLLARLDDLGRTNWWATLTNGDHGMSRTATGLAELERFYDRFLKGERNGWESRPRVRLWWEAGRDGRRAPGWESGAAVWSEARRRAAGELVPWRLRLGVGGTLDERRAGAGTTSFVATAPLGTQGVGNPRYGYPSLPDAYLWSSVPPRGTAAAFTTAPFDRDRTFLGSASLDLWLRASGPTVPLEVTLTEVRPDGQETFVQKGWLEVSRRRLDPARSTALRPYQTHRAADVQPLSPGQVVAARVEVFPFGTVVRRGSRLRVWLTAPTPLPELWAFPPSAPVAVDVLHDADHPSALVLPLVPGASAAPRPLPTCGSVIRQPCRPDPLADRALSGRRR